MGIPMGGIVAVLRRCAGPMVLLTALVGSGGLRAQTPVPSGLDPAKHITQYVHEAWTTEHGLPQSTVWAIAQTPDGYLWLGTEFGLVRFDGVRCTVFNTRNTPELKNDDVRSLLVSRAGGLWIGTHRGGLTLMRYGEFRTYRREDGLPDDFITCFHEDQDAGLWVGTGGGLARRKGQRFEGVPGLNVRVNALCQDRAGTLWVGADTGVYLLKEEQLVPYQDADGGLAARVRAIREDASGNLWVSTVTGLVRLCNGQRTTYTTRDGLAADSATALGESGGDLWVGTWGGGLHRYRDGRFETFGTREGLSADNVTSLFADREGGLWVGTYGGGLNRLRNPLFTTYAAAEGFPGHSLSSVYGDAEGTLWVGTIGAGLIRFRDGRATKYTKKDGLPSDVVDCTWRTADGVLWIGTRDGLARLENDRVTSLPSKDGFPAGPVLALYEDRAGTLWIAGDRGLQRWRDGALSPSGFLESFPDWVQRNILSIREGGDGTLWLATVGGVVGHKNGEVINLKAKDGLVSDVVLSLLPDGDDLWVGTEGGGLHHIRRGKVTAFRLQDRVPVQNVWSILEDGRGHLWLSSSQGILRLRKSELLGVVAGVRRDFGLRLFDRLDGLKTTEMDGGVGTAGWRTADGRLWFPSTKGLVALDPNAVHANPPPAARVEQLVVDGRETALEEGFELPPGKGQIEFHYTALSLLTPKRTRFRYMLEPLDDDWVDAGTRRVAHYGHVPAGRYRFLVQAANEEGVWGEQDGASFAFRVRPHFYETGWFYGVNATGLVLLGAALYRIRDRRLKRRTRLLAQLVDNRTRELKQEVTERERAEEALRQSHEELEARVLERTADLATANQELAKDIAERKRAEAALRDSEERFHTLARVSPVGIFRTDASGHCVYVNERWCEITGLTCEEALGEGWARNLHPADRDHVFAAWNRAVKDHLPFASEYRFQGTGGVITWVLGQAVAETGPGAEVAGYVGTITDITEHRRAEEELRRHEQLLSAVFDASRDGIGVEQDERFVYVNEALARLYGYETPEELLGRRVSDIQAPEDDQTLLTYSRQRMRGEPTPVGYEFKGRRRDGGTLDLEASVATAVIGDRPSIVAVIRDIADRKRAEVELRESETFLRLSQQAGHVGSWELDRPTGNLKWSEETARIHGITLEQFDGTLPSALSFVHPDDLPRVQEARQALQTQRVATAEYRIRRPNGEVRYLWAMGEVLSEAVGRPPRVLGIVIDVTDRKQAEEALRREEQRLRASLREKEALLKEVHHRVKNNLQVISSLLHLQAAQVRDPAVADLFTESQNRVRSMALVHESLYRSGDLARIDLASHVEGLCAHLYRCYGVDANRVVLHARVADVTLDLDRAVPCGLIVNELVSNALKHAFPHGRAGRLSVEIHAGNGQSTLVIGDDGVGLPPDLDFRRTDSLGLQLVCGLVQQLRGDIALDRGGGTTFRITFTSSG